MLCFKCSSLDRLLRQHVTFGGIGRTGPVRGQGAWHLSSVNVKKSHNFETMTLLVTLINLYINDI